MTAMPRGSSASVGNRGGQPGWVGGWVGGANLTGTDRTCHRTHSSGGQDCPCGADYGPDGAAEHNCGQSQTAALLRCTSQGTFQRPKTLTRTIMISSVGWSRQHAPERRHCKRLLTRASGARALCIRVLNNFSSVVLSCRYEGHDFTGSSSFLAGMCIFLSPSIKIVVGHSSKFAFGSRGCHSSGYELIVMVWRLSAAS